MSTEPLSVEDRRDILETEVTKYVKQGYRVTSRTDTTAQLVKPKKFSKLWAILWFCLLIFPFVIYILLYMAKKDKTIYLEIDKLGRIKRT